MKEYTEEELKIMTIEEIKKHFLEVRSVILSKELNDEIIKNLEIYFCYITREIQNRN